MGVNIIDKAFNTIEIYQIRDIEKCDYAFRSYEEAEKCLAGYSQTFNGETYSEQTPFYGIQITDYKRVYEYEEWVDLDELIGSGDSLLNRIYYKFNMEIPADFNGHSLSVSDLICINEESWYYVDNIGFKYIGDFEAGYFRDDGFRVCSDCGACIVEGYVVHDGDAYYCEGCMWEHYTEEEWERMYEEEYECYWTQWC